jgi:hypothetical protein
MTTTEDAKPKTYILHFRCPPRLLAALQKASEFSSLSDVAREAVAQAMKARGLLEDKP